MIQTFVQYLLNASLSRDNWVSVDSRGGVEMLFGHNTDSCVGMDVDACAVRKEGSNKGFIVKFLSNVASACDALLCRI